MFCSNCGFENKMESKFCVKCGGRIINEVTDVVNPIPANIASERSVGKLIAMCVVWTIVFWVASIFVVGAIAGALNPQDGAGAGERAGEALGGLFLLISVCLSVVLTIVGKLPGTKKS